MTLQTRKIMNSWISTRCFQEEKQSSKARGQTIHFRCWIQIVLAQGLGQSSWQLSNIVRLNKISLGCCLLLNFIELFSTEEVGRFLFAFTWSSDNMASACQNEQARSAAKHPELQAACCRRISVSCPPALPALDEPGSLEFVRDPAWVHHVPANGETDRICDVIDCMAMKQQLSMGNQHSGTST